MRVAQALNYPMVNNYLSLGHGLYVVEIHIRASLHDMPIGQILGMPKVVFRLSL